MKIADIMNKHIISITENMPIKEGARLIFSLGLGAIPVVKDKKLVGILTGHDILSKMYPTMQELVDDFIHAGDFEQMEKNLKYLLDTPVGKIMNKGATAVKPQTPIMQAQSLMLIHRFSHLPVINEKRELLGIVSQGDIFRQLIKNQMPKLEKERYTVFIAKHYDNIVDWEKRLNWEFPVLIDLFKKESIKSILDLGVWTGKYTIKLAKRSRFKILGLDHNPEMITICQQKRAELPLAIKKSIHFQLTDFKNLTNKINQKFDAAICMGNALPYIPLSLSSLLEETASVLTKKNPLIIIQMLNLQKILKTKNKLLSFIMKKGVENKNLQYLLFEFLEIKDQKHLIHNSLSFDYDGKNWLYKGLTTIPINNISKDDLELALRKAGFDNLIFAGYQGKYQDEFGEFSFAKPFNVKEDDFLNVLAKKKI